MTQKTPQELYEIFAKEFSDFVEKTYPKNGSLLHQAINYALTGPGKRVRPLLCLLSCEAAGENFKKALPAAFALEMIHTYSLVHDDLPILDNDDFRRGRKSVHKAFDDAQALLVGDALLTDAFFVLGKENPELVPFLASACGSSGMVLGQSLDVLYTKSSEQSLEVLQTIHLNKTAKLLSISCYIGARSAGLSHDKSQLFKEFGEKIGLAFQILDDLLDDYGDTGKTKGKDLEQGKLTYLKVMSRREALAEAGRLTEESLKAISNFSNQTKELINLCESLLARHK